MYIRISVLLCGMFLVSMQDSPAPGDEHNVVIDVPENAKPGHLIIDLKKYQAGSSRTRYEVTQIMNNADVYNTYSESDYKCGANLCSDHYGCYFCLTPGGIYKTTQTFHAKTGQQYIVTFRITSYLIDGPRQTSFVLKLNIISACQQLYTEFSKVSKVSKVTKSCSPKLSKLPARLRSGLVTTITYDVENRHDKLFQAGFHKSRMTLESQKVKFSLLGFNQTGTDKIYLVQDHSISLNNNYETIDLNITSPIGYRTLEVTLTGSFQNIQMKANAIDLLKYSPKEFCRQSSCIKQIQKWKTLAINAKCKKKIPLLAEFQECLVAPTVQFLSNVNTLLGHTFVVTCNVGSLTDYTVTWHFIDSGYQTELKSDAKRTIEGSRMTFLLFSLEHIGQYRCMATNQKSTVASNVFTINALDSLSYELRLRVMGLTFNDTLNDRGSGAFIHLASKVNNAVSGVIKKSLNKRISLYRIRSMAPGSIVFKGVLIVKRELSENLVGVYRILYEELNNSTSRSELEGLETKERDLQLTSSEICPPDKDTPIAGLTLNWPATKAFDTASLKCPFNPDTPVTRLCTKNGVARWDAYDAKPCTVPKTQLTTPAVKLMPSSLTTEWSTHSIGASQALVWTKSTSPLQMTSTSKIYHIPSTTIIKEVIATTKQTRQTSTIATKSSLSRRDKKLHDIARNTKKVNIEEAKSISKQVTNLTNPAGESLSPDSLTLVASILEKLENSAGSNKEVADNVMDCIDNILYAEDRVMEEAQKKNDTSRKILKIIGTIGEKIANHNNETVLINRKKFAFGVVKKVKNTFKGLTASLQMQNKAVLDVKEEPSSVPSAVASVALPKTFITDSGITSSTLAIVVTAFVDTVLFQSKNILAPEKDSPVISLEIRKHSVTALPNPVLLSFKSNRDADSAQCGFWDTKIAPFGAWSSVGCYKIGTESDKTTCGCNHLTNFALLFGAKTLESKDHTEALTVVTYVGASISLAGAVVTLLTYTLYPKLRDSNPPKIMMNLIAALIAFYIVFLAGIDQKEPLAACRTVAILLQYFFLAVFSWSIVEGFTSFRGIVKPMAQEIRKFIQKAMLFGWGVPVILTALGASVWPDNYGSNSSCVVSGLPLFITVLAPVGLVLVFNYAALAGIMCSLNQSSKRYSHNSMTHRDRLRIIVAFILLFGLTWIFGLLVISNDILAFQYLFCILSGLHGFFIFLFYCVRNENVRRAWAESLHIHRSTFYTTSTSDTKKTDVHSESAA